MAVEFSRLTLAKPCTIEGPGLHSGVHCECRIEPAESGITFHANGKSTVATPHNVTDTSRCTRLGDISTVEHVMSALAGAGVTDADIVLTAEEPPVAAGASGLFLDAVHAAGTVKLGTASLSLFERVFFVEGEVRIGVSKGEGHWRFDFESGERWPGEQSFECSISPETYAKDIAGARTFAFEEEVGPIRAAGLAKGLDDSSALILGPSGYVNEARWPDEPARHKLLDLIGDLYLSGVPPVLLNVVAVRSGHRTNVEAAKRLADHALIERG